MEMVMGGMAILAALLLASVILTLRVLLGHPASASEPEDPTDVLWKVYPPIQRLLDPADLRYLRQRGVGEEQIQKLRSERRQIFRLCLRSMVRDFKRTEFAVKLLMVQSAADRPDLAEELARQRFALYRNLIKAQTWLMMHACGFDTVVSLDLLQPLKIMQAQLQQLAATPQFAMSAST